MNPEQPPAVAGQDASGGEHGKPQLTPRLLPFAVAVIVAIALIATVLQIARWLDSDLTVEPGMLGRLGHAITGSETPDIETVGLRNSLSATAVGALLGWLAAAIALRWTNRPRLIFIVVTVAGFIGWGIMAFTQAETIETALWLNGLHIVAAVPIIGTLARELPTSMSRSPRVWRIRSRHCSRPRRPGQKRPFS